MSQRNSERDHPSPPPTPRWVKVSGIIIIALALLIGILHLTGNSFGPGSHSLPMGHSGQEP